MGAEPFDHCTYSVSIPGYEDMGALAGLSSRRLGTSKILEEILASSNSDVSLRTALVPCIPENPHTTLKN